MMHEEELMASLSQDLREKIIQVWEAGEETRAEIASRFIVSEAMVKKLIAQKKRLGHVRALYERVGRKAKIGELEQERLLELIEREPGITLQGMKEALKLACSIQSIHRTLQGLGLRYKKKRSAPAHETGTTSARRAKRGVKGKPNSWRGN
jgi:transposase